MPSQKPWLLRLPLILKALEESEQKQFSSRDVEMLFQVRRSAAYSLMNVAGIRSGTVSRANLLHYLHHSPDAQNAMQELGRRKRLAATIEKASEEAKLRKVAIPVTPADEWCTLQDLPNVSIEAGLLRVAFSSPIELMADLFRFAKAAGNDLDAFEKACGVKPEKAERESAA